MDTRFAERVGEELVSERKIAASLMEAAVHGRTVAFLCPTLDSAVRCKNELTKKAKALKNAQTDPTLITREDVYFRSGGCVRFVVYRSSRHYDGIMTDEVMWI